MRYSPIALFVYNRPAHTKKTIEALKRNSLAKYSDLIIFSDAAKNLSNEDSVNETRQYIKGIGGFKSLTIFERGSNFGLANSIIDGVTYVSSKYGKVIVLEDDLLTSPYFLNFMNAGLDAYESHSDVISIHGYVYPISGLENNFFLRGADCWGWATWQDRWKLFEPNGNKLLQQLIEKKLLKRFDFNGAYSFSDMLKAQISGENNSWAIRWHASAFLLNKLTLYPRASLIKNIGNDGTGTHSGSTDIYSTDIYTLPINLAPISVEESELAYKQFEKFFRRNKSFFLRGIRKLKWFYSYVFSLRI